MTGRILRVDPSSTPAELWEPLQRVLTGGRPLLPADQSDESLLNAARLHDPAHDETALLLPTSGSTGTPKIVELSRDALLASAHATHERIGPPGPWLLALPLTHIAGWQVLVRSVLTGRPPVHLRGSFTPDAFFENVTGVRYCSLVPTQLSRLLDDPRPGPDDLTVLLGGAAAAPELLTRAAKRGYRVVTTYGSSETAGGCVYDGRPLNGVETALTDDGRLRIGGVTIATGYRNPPSDNPFHMEDGIRWFTTSDLAELADGQVRIIGRADDVITTGGEKVHPLTVEHALLEVPGITGAIVVGVDDPEWGQRVVAVVTGTPPSVEVVRARLDLPSYALPREVLTVSELPLLSIGKPDRRAAAVIAKRNQVP